MIRPLNHKTDGEKPDEYALEREDKSSLVRVLEWLFHPRRRWARNSLTIGTGALALITLSKIFAALFILLFALRVIGKIYLTVTRTRTFRKLFKARRLHLTSEGWWFVIFTIAIGTAAINTGVNLLYLILSMMLSFIVISGILSEITFRRLKITRSMPTAVYAHERFESALLLHNDKKVFPSFSLFIDDSPGSGPEITRLKACYALKIPAKGRMQLPCPMKIGRRGRFIFNGFRVHSGYPFNFFKKHMRIPGIDSILVYPRLYQLNTTEVLAGGERADALRKLHLRAAGEEDFRGLKEYREGDNPHHIHWVSSARHGKLMVMEFEKQRANHVIVLLDTYLPVGSQEKLDALEHAVSTAATLLTFFNQRHYETGLAAFAPKLLKIRPDSGKRHYYTLMESLARLDPGKRGLDELVDRLDGRQLRDSAVFVVTLKDSSRNAEVLRTLSIYSPVVKEICVTGESFARYVILPEEGPGAAGPAPQSKAEAAR